MQVIENKHTMLSMVLKLLLQAALVLLPVVVVMMDYQLREKGQSEFSITELIQEFCLFTSVILFGLAARNTPQSRGFLVLVTGMFATMLVREFDAIFDRIYHGFWVWPALLVFVSTTIYAFKCAGTVKKPMLEFMDSKNFVYINTGLIIILAFSRIFGSGFLWRDIMGDDYSTVYKSIIQESLELLGYIFVLYGSIFVLSDVLRSKRLER